MTIVAPHLEEETRLAWEEYLAAVRDVAGDGYEATEMDAWDQLQSRLAAVAGAEPAQDAEQLG